MRPVVSLPPISLLQENDIKGQPPGRCIYCRFQGVVLSKFIFATENTEVTEFLLNLSLSPYDEKSVRKFIDIRISHLLEMS
jgi:hypothetical protein